MTPGFLNAVALYYFKNFKTEMSKFCFVFPSQRSGIFFTNHLRQFIKSPIWSPNAITINDLFVKISNSTIADNITLLFNLHQCYNEVCKKNTSFEEFLPWGEMFLNDFDDIDRHLTPIDQLFSNLVSLKELDDDYSHLSKKQLEAIQSFWSSFDSKKRSEHQAVFIETWKQIPDVYYAFKKKLMKQGLAYEGMVYRKVAEHIQQGKHINVKWDHIIFVGLNALTPTEIKLMNHLKKRNISSFFWDYSPWMINQSENLKGVKKHGPGFFIEENLFRFPHPKDFKLPSSEQPPEICITAVANPTEQLKSVHQFLEKEYLNNMKSAVILADETLLMPVLHGIPSNVDRINVTMGYPLKSTPAYGLIEALLNLQQQARTGGTNEVWLYHRHVLPLLQHQYLSMLAEEDCRTLHKNLVNRNYIFVKAKELHTNALFKLIFKKVDGGFALASYLTEVLLKVYELLKSSDNKILEQEFTFTIYKTIVRLQDLLEQNQQVELDSKTWIKLLKKLTDYQTVPFRGEPLAGLQIMGILETRALDFDKLIILDLNEGVFPRTSPPNTFIPASLRAGFELPTIEFQDAIFSYYFFRLIHRAKKVELLYSTGSQGMKSNEMSRYLYQLKYEFNASIQYKTTPGKVNLMDSPVVSAQKSESVIKKLEVFTPQGNKILSPSALSTYIECPMRFYYQKVVEIKEPDVITEEADARIFGLIFHDVVEKLYEKHIGNVVTSEDINTWLADSETISNLIKQGFNTHIMDYDKGQKSFTEIHGKNVMVFEVIKRYLVQFLKIERLRTPFNIVDLEKQVNWTFTNTSDTVINIGGIIDRLEEKDNVLKVMDYKTGTGTPVIDSISDLFDTDKHKKNKAIFQTLLYALILDETNDQSLQLQANVIWVRDVFKADYDINLYLKDKKNKTPIFLHIVKDEFKNQLDKLLTEIYDETIAFSPCSNIDKCKFCTYKILCNR